MKEAAVERRRGKGGDKGLGGGEASAAQRWDGEVKEKEGVGSLPQQIRKLFDRAEHTERVQN